MSYIKTPVASVTVGTVGDFLNAHNIWMESISHVVDDDGFLGQIWYRGINERFQYEIPGVYRINFTERAAKLNTSGDPEEKRLRLEREMLSQFRVAGSAHLNRESVTEIYFTAQHYGMPTRLLDWSTNPLAALFFATDGDDTKNGVIFAMDARRLIPPNAEKKSNEKLYRAVMTMRNPFVENAIAMSFWSDAARNDYPHILPVRPEAIPGRITQQSACFTLHMHNAKPVENDSMKAFSILGSQKSKIRAELHGLNINAFTIYPGLDQLSKEIKSRWSV